MKLTNTKKTVLALMGLTVFITGVGAEQVFKVELTVNKNDTAKLGNITVQEGTERTYHGNKGSYHYYLTDKEGEKLWQEKRTMNWYLFTNPPRPIKSKKVILEIPYEEEALTLKLQKNQRILLNTSLTNRLCSNFDNTCISYCDGKGVDVDCTCGDDICQESTNERELCSQDCSQPQDTRAETNITEDQTKEVVDSSYSNYLLIAIIVAAVLIGLFLLSGKVKIEA
jgi:hypothetical protein